MAEKKTEDFLKKTKSAIVGFGTKTLKDVKEQAVPFAEKVSEQVKSTSKKAADAVESKIKDARAAAEQKKEEKPEIRMISTQDAIKIIYYLMAADGEIFHSEEEKFDAIGADLDPDFADHKAQIVAECQSLMENVIDPEDYYDVLQDGVENALASSVMTEDAFITPKLLLWDMLTIAYSDESYDDTERRLIKYVVRKLNIDKAIFLEMESSILTLMDMEKELAWIKTTDRPYTTIETMVNEITKRKDVIFESVKNLIAL